MRDVNSAFEKAVRRDPANWFWVHNRWKLPKNMARKAANVSLEPVEGASRTQIH
jgi:lauroyl/myristoyl acyltransferase